MAFAGSPRSKLLAIAILLILIAALWLLAIAPLINWFADRQDAMDRDARLLAGYDRVARDRPQVEKELQSLKLAQSSIPGLVTGNTPELAAAMMQSEIKRVIDGNSGDLRSVQTLSASRNGDFEKVTMHYELSATLTAVSAILYQLETHIPYLFVENVDIRALEALPANPKASDGVEQKLTVRWNVYGYRWVGTK